MKVPSILIGTTLFALAAMIGVASQGSTPSPGETEPVTLTARGAGGTPRAVMVAEARLALEVTASGAPGKHKKPKEKPPASPVLEAPEAPAVPSGKNVPTAPPARTGPKAKSAPDPAPNPASPLGAAQSR